jgi:mono/diheme cytochrome c family protein
MKLGRFAFTAGLAGTALIAGLTLTGPLARVAQAQDTPQEERGKAVFDYWCAPCHAAGPGHPGTQGLQVKYGGTDVPAVLEERADLTPVLVETFVRQGVLSMAPFRKTEITDAQLEDLAAYLAE